MARLVKAGETTAARRRVYFDLRGPDGVSPVSGESGQPQISLDGAAWTNTGIGVLTSIGNGRHYADLTAGVVANPGAHIETRYVSANTADCPGDSVDVIGYDPYDGARLGLTALPNFAAGAAGGLMGSTPPGYYTAPDNAGIGNAVTAATAAATAAGNAEDAATASAAAIAAIQAKTDNLPASPAAVGSTMKLDLTQPIDDVKTETVGGALSGAWTTGWGKVWRDVGNKLLKLWGPGNNTATPSAVFSLDDASNPTTKTPV